MFFFKKRTKKLLRFWHAALAAPVALSGVLEVFAAFSNGGVNSFRCFMEISYATKKPWRFPARAFSLRYGKL
jgi:hypothetical protein